MSLSQRLLLACGCLLAAGTAQWSLKLHLAGEDSAEDLRLRGSLADLPLTLRAGADEEWVGQMHPGHASLAKQVAFADEFIYRLYRAGEGPVVSLYAVWSSKGEDRKHH